MWCVRCVIIHTAQCDREYNENMKYNKGGEFDTEMNFSHPILRVLRSHQEEWLHHVCLFGWDSNPEDQFSKVYGGIWTPQLSIWQFIQQLLRTTTVSSTIHLHDFCELLLTFSAIFQALFVQVGWDSRCNEFDQMWHEQVSGEFVLIAIIWWIFDHLWMYSKVKIHRAKHETHSVWNKETNELQKTVCNWQFLRRILNNAL